MEKKIIMLETITINCEICKKDFWYQKAAHFRNFRESCDNGLKDNKKDKLIERITTCLEEYGMTKFNDRFPAMAVLQIIKDSGKPEWFSESGNNNLVPLNEKELRKIIEYQLCINLELISMNCVEEL